MKICTERMLSERLEDFITLKGRGRTDPVSPLGSTYVVKQLISFASDWESPYAGTYFYKFGKNGEAHTGNRKSMKRSQCLFRNAHRSSTYWYV